MKNNELKADIKGMMSLVWEDIYDSDDYCLVCRYEDYEDGDAICLLVLIDLSLISLRS